MPAPAPSWNTVRVYATWTESEDGTLKAGTWTAVLPTRITNATDDVIVPAGPFGGGALNRSSSLGPSLAVQLPASDDPDNYPLDVRPIITVTFTDGSKPERFQPPLPVALSGDPVGVNLRTIPLSDQIAAVIDYAPADFLAGLQVELDALNAAAGTPGVITATVGASGAFPVTNNAAYALTLTGNPTLTLTGATGTGCTFEVTGAGTIQGVAVTTGGQYVAYRFATGWLIRGLAAGTTTSGNGGGGGGGQQPIGVAAIPVTFNDAAGTSQDTYTVPTSTGVTYKIGTTIKAAGTYPGTGTVTVTAVANSGYTLTGTSTWSHTFDTTDTPPPPPPAAGSGWQTVAAWNFGSPDGTALNGLAPSSGSGTLAVTAYNSGDQQIDVLNGKARLQAYNFFVTAGIAAQTKGIAYQADLAMAGSAQLGTVAVGNDIGSPILTGNHTGFNVAGSGVVTGSHLGAGAAIYTAASGSPIVPANSTIRAEFTPGSGDQGCTGTLYADGALIGTIVGTGFTWVGRGVGLYMGQSYHVDSFIDNMLVEGLL